jgi:hypothetical protein
LVILVLYVFVILLFLRAVFLILLIDILRVQPLVLSRPNGCSLLLTHALVPGNLIRCEKITLGIGFIHARIEYALALVHVDQDHAGRGRILVAHYFYALIGCLRIYRPLQDPLSAQGELIFDLLGQVVRRHWLLWVQGSVQFGHRPVCGVHFHGAEILHRLLHLWGDPVVGGLASRVHRLDPAHDPATFIHLFETFLHRLGRVLEILYALFWPRMIQPQRDVIRVR